MGEMANMGQTELLHWIAFYEIEREERDGRPARQSISLQGMTPVEATKHLDRILLGK